MEHRNISRRELLTGAALGAASVAALGMTGCAPQASTSEGCSNSEAAGSHSWEVKPAAITDVQETLDTEVLIIGGGYSGTCCAASAAENGLKVTLVEKDSVLNGHGVGGTGALASRALDQYPDYHIDKPINAERWIKTCGGRCRESLVAVYFRESERCMNWLLDISDADGAKCMITANASNQEVHKEEHSYHMITGGTIGGQHQMNDSAEYRFEAWAEKKGAEFVFERPAVQLVQDASGKVTGAICQKKDGSYVQYNASKGVVLATGDISYNDEMMDYFAPVGNKVMTRLCGDTGNVGDGINMASWVGAALQDAPWPTMMHPQAGAFFHGPFMFVDDKGKRFMNEATWVQGKCVGVMYNAKQDHAWSVFDANWQTDLLNGLPYGGGMFWDSFRMFGSDYQDAVDYFAGVVEKGVTDTPQNYVKADTLDELAKKMGVDADGLKKSVERYNTMCAAGEDTDFNKEKIFLTPVKQGPFYGCKVGAGLLAVVGGIHISDDFEVLTADDEVIPGLYAIGNCSGDMYAYDYPINIQGNSHGRCLVEGKLLGEHLAGK